MLSDEEKKKVIDAAEIRLTQVEVLDIASIKTVKPTNNFSHHVGKYTLSGNKTTISFPASGFKADMVGLTYGEIGDISLAMDAVNVDKYYKRLSTIYNKMTNLSCGPFESFDEFLKNFAFTDIPLAIYGLYVSSFPEVQTIATTNFVTHFLTNDDIALAIYLYLDTLKLEPSFDTLFLIELGGWFDERYV